MYYVNKCAHVLNMLTFILSKNLYDKNALKETHFLC